MRICEAVINEDEEVIDILLSRNDESVENKDRYHELMNSRIILAPLLQNGKVSISVAIRVAMTTGKLLMAGRVLQHVSHDPRSGIVDWHDLELSYIDPHWLQGHGINSFTYVGLSSNSLRNIPEQILRFNNLQKLQIHHNRITAIPPELFTLPRIKDIDLSFNSITSLPPDLHSRSLAPSLESINLSNNQLNDLPLYLKNSHIRLLDISSNLFSRVPSCIIQMTHLNTLNISSNIGIEEVPYELGNIRNLTFLGINGLPYIKNVPTSKKSSPLEFLKSRARTLQTVTHYDVIVLSTDHTPSHITDNVFNAIERQSKRKQFSFLHFKNNNEFYTFQCYLSLPCSLYVLIWNVLSDIDNLYPLLSHLFLYNSSPTVIIAACSTDHFINEEYVKQVEERIKESKWNQYRERVTVATISVDENSMIGRVNSINSLMETIERKGSSHRTRLTVPNSYSVLSEYTKRESTRLLENNNPPLISSWDMWELVRSSPHHDLAGHKELSLVTKFLQSVAAIVLLPSNSTNERDYYILNRQWFVNSLSSLLKSHQNIRISNGLYPIRNVCDLLYPHFTSEVPYAVYTVASLLSLAIPVSSHNVLINSMLSQDNNDPIASDFSSQYHIQRLYTLQSIPVSFWPRLLSHLLVNMNNIVMTITQDKSGDILINDMPYAGPLGDNINWNYWRRGMIVWINGTSLVYCIQSLNDYSVLISVSNTPLGVKAINLLSLTINSLLINWYPQLWSTVQVCAVCHYCFIDDVFTLFPVVDCLQSLTRSCCLSCSRGHDISTINLIPDLCFDDFNVIQMNQLDVDLNDKTACLTCPPSETVFKGNYGKVPIAVKPHPPPNVTSDNPFLDYWHDITILHYILDSTQCPYVIEPLLSTVDQLSLVFRCAMYCSLDDVILDRTITLLPLLRMRIVYQLASALETLHSLKIIHRNVSLDNIIVYSLSLDDNVNIKLGGFSKSCHELSQGLAVGEYGRFPAPEMSKTSYEYDQRVDVFSFAFTSYEILTRRKLTCRRGVPFQTASGSSERPNLQPLNSLCPYYTPLLEKCWSKEPNKRPFFIEIVHQFTKPMQLLTREGQCINELHEYNASAVRYKREPNGTFSCDLYVCSSILSMKDSTVLAQLSLPGFKPINSTSLPTQCIICMACTTEYLWVSFQFNFVRIYSADTLEFIKEISFDSHIIVMAVSPDCVYLGKEDGEIQVFNLSQPSPLHAPYNTRVISYQQPIKSLQVLDDCIICCTMKSFARIHPNTLNVIQEFPLVSETSVKAGVVAVDRINNTEHLWVSFRRLQELVVYDAMKGEAMYGVNCSDVIGRKRSEVWVNCLQVVLDTVWVGMNSGHLLSFSAYSITPLLLTYCKPHVENIRQLVLLQPSYWNPDYTSRFYDDESVDSQFDDSPINSPLPISYDESSVPSNPSIPAIPITQVASVLTCGQGVNNNIPTVSNDGILLHETTGGGSNGLYVLKMDGPDASGSIKLECQAQRALRPYMPNYDQIYNQSIDNESHRQIPPTPLINGETTPIEQSSEVYESMQAKHDPELADFIHVSHRDVPSIVSSSGLTVSSSNTLPNKPTLSSSKLTTPSSKPTTPSSKPTTPSSKPTTPSSKPTSRHYSALPSRSTTKKPVIDSDSDSDAEGYISMRSASESIPRPSREPLPNKPLPNEPLPNEPLPNEPLLNESIPRASLEHEALLER